MKSEYILSMQERERGYINGKEIHKYNREGKTKQDKPGGEPEPAKETLSPTEESEDEDPAAQKKLNSKLNIFSLVQGAGLEESSLVYGVMKRLLSELYGQHLFYRKALEKYPDLEDQILKTVIALSADRTVGKKNEKKEKKINSAKKLAELQFPDEELHEVFYKMLKGNQLETRASRFKDAREYPSLLGYITIGKESKVSIYLAKRELLMAFYEDAALVEKLIAERRELYNSYTKGEIEQADGKAALEKNFRHETLDALLEYNISKTKPPL
jgi:hypothetical protein